MSVDVDFDFMLEQATATALSNPAPTSTASAGISTSSAGAGATWAGVNMEDPVIWIGTGETTRESVTVPSLRWKPPPGILTPTLSEAIRGPEPGSGDYMAGADIERRDQYAASEAAMQMYRWQGTPEYERWGDMLVDIGLVDEKDARNFAALDKWWQAGVELSANFARVGRVVTPWGAARMIASDEDAIKGQTGEGGSTPRTVTQKTFNLTSPQDARGIISDVLTRHLGRRPTDEEFSAFTATLNAAERANPTTTVVNYDADGNATSTTTGGLSAAGAATAMEDEARALPEYAEFQAASYYANALFGALDSPV